MAWFHDILILIFDCQDLLVIPLRLEYNGKSLNIAGYGVLNSSLDQAAPGPK